TGNKSQTDLQIPCRTARQSVKNLCERFLHKMFVYVSVCACVGVFVCVCVCVSIRECFPWCLSTARLLSVRFLFYHCSQLGMPSVALGLRVWQKSLTSHSDGNLHD